MIAILNLVQLVFCFGIFFYLVELGSANSFFVTENRPFRIGEALFLSFVTITTLGAGDMYPVKLAAKLLTIAEAFIGLLMIVFIVGRHMAYYASASQKDG